MSASGASGPLVYYIIGVNLGYISHVTVFVLTSRSNLFPYAFILGKFEKMIFF